MSPAQEAAHWDKDFLRDHPMKLFQTSAQNTGLYALIDEPGLTVGSLPTSFAFENLDTIETCEMPWSGQKEPLMPRPGSLGNLLLPLRDRLLSSDPEYDLKQYMEEIHSKRNCDLVRVRLPLASVCVEKDEGLSFPSTTKRFRALLQRELERDEIIISAEAQKLADDQGRARLDHCANPPFKIIAKPPENLRPPLSPVSDDEMPPIPDPAYTNIDLTSGPSSPSNGQLHDFEADLAEESLSSGMYSLPTTEDSSFDLKGHTLPQVAVHGGELRMSTPLLQQNSEKLDVQRLQFEQGMIEQKDAVDLSQEDATEGKFFEEALEAVIQSRHAHGTLATAMERFDPIVTTSRVPVPSLDFDSTQNDWKGQCSSPEKQFSRLSESLNFTSAIPLASEHPEETALLKWNPLPRHLKRFNVCETIIQAHNAENLVKTPTNCRLLSDWDYVTIDPELAILKQTVEDEISSDNEESTTSSPCALTLPFPWSEDVRETEHESTSGMQDIAALISSRMSKMAPSRTDIVSAPLQARGTTTSSLLSGFLSLRTAKRQRIDHVESPSLDLRDQHRYISSSKITDHSMIGANIHDRGSNLLAIPDINADLPVARATYMISLALSRSLMRQIETQWGSNYLIDRDYSRHDQITWSRGSACRDEKPSTLSYEADISLSPSVGIVVTNLLKIRQRSLPGSKQLAPVREKVKRVSQLYKCLFVLVSESNPSGDFLGTIDDSSATSYIDFVGFTTSLDTHITTYYVPGSENTLGRWILSLMCSHSQQSIGNNRFLSPKETAWELFFRRAGLNVVEAQILAGLLHEEYPDAGLVAFMSLTAEEKVARYGQILGGPKNLLKCDEVFRCEWSEIKAPQVLRERLRKTYRCFAANNSPLLPQVKGHEETNGMIISQHV